MVKRRKVFYIRVIEMHQDGIY